MHVPILSRRRPPLTKRERREILTAWRFLLPSLAGAAVFVLVPFFDALRRSLFDALGGNFEGLSNFSTVLGNQAFQLASGNTARFLVLCLPPLVVISLLLACLVQTLGAGRKAFPTRFFRTSFLIPMAVPVASVVLLWQALFKESGMLSGLMLGLGLSGGDWLNSSSAMGVLVGSYLWRNLGYDMILWLAGLSAISPDLAEAAQADGAGSLQIFFRITLPLLRPTAYTVLVLSLLNSFKVFREAYLVSGSYPHDSIYLLQHLFNNWFLSFELQKMCAGAVLMAAFMFAAVLVLQLLLGRGEQE